MILLLARQGFEADKLVDFRGLNARSPCFAGMMAILMFSLGRRAAVHSVLGKLGSSSGGLDRELHLARRVAVLVLRW